MPGATYTEVVISPLLANAPYALYKSALEPIMRWTLTKRRAALVYGAAVAKQGRAALLVPEQDQGKTAAALQAVAEGGYAFMGDDFVILTDDGRVWSFPKPVTVTAEALRATAVTAHWRRRERLKLWLRNSLYGRAARAAGLYLSRGRWPAATLNLLWQRLWSPPKRPIETLITAVSIADQAQLAELVLLRAGDGGETAVTLSDALDFVCARQDAAQGFPPYDLLLTQLGQNANQHWRSEERAIIRQALAQTAVCRTVSAPLTNPQTNQPTMTHLWQKNHV
jgi:hypothetical protein